MTRFSLRLAKPLVYASALSGTAVVACNTHSESPPTADAALQTPPLNAPSRDGCITPAPDSASAVRAAHDALIALENENALLRANSFLRHHEGMLISFVSHSPDVLSGGGGLVWVDRDGCVMVIKQYE